MMLVSVTGAGKWVCHATSTCIYRGTPAHVADLLTGLVHPGQAVICKPYEPCGNPLRVAHRV